MPIWLYEDGHLVAKDTSGAVLFKRAMAEQQARRMADLVNIETEIGDHLLRKRVGAGAVVPGAAPVLPGGRKRGH